MNDLNTLIESAKTSAGLNGHAAYLDQFMSRRDACADRDYHMLESRKSYEERKRGDLCICLDCEAWFGKGDFHIENLKFYDDEDS